MGIINCDSCQDTYLEKQRIKSTPAEKPVVVSIVKFRYEGHDVVVIDQEIYSDLTVSHWVDGLTNLFPTENRYWSDDFERMSFNKEGRLTN